MKKVVLITAAAALLIPAAVSFADSSSSFSFHEAVNTAYKNDLTMQIEDVPKLSSGVQMYQGQLPLRGLEDAADIQQEYAKQSREWNAELSAYRTMYDFVIAKEGLDIATRSLSHTEKDLEIVKIRRENGVASDLDVLQAEMAVTNAKKNYENARMGYNIAEKSAQQKLGLELGGEPLNISLPSFSLLDEEDYDPVKIADEARKGHESLRTVRYLIRTYERILDKVDNLTPIPSGSAGTGELEAKLADVTAKLGELKSADPATVDPTDILQLEALATSLQTQIAMAAAQAAQAPKASSVSKAEEELEEYYEAELNNARIQLLQQIQALELLSHTYAERFKALEKQIKLQEQAVEEALELYEANRKLLENGMIAPADLEQLRLNLENAEFQLLQQEKDYMVLRKEFSLFLDGYVAGM